MVVIAKNGISGTRASYFLRTDVPRTGAHPRTYQIVSLTKVAVFFMSIILRLSYMVLAGHIALAGRENVIAT